MKVFYNENNAAAANWLRNLEAAGKISPGVINEQSITELKAESTAPISHFFAGIGGWDYALRLAGWPAELPVWTGSCPCQPFSVAGKREGVNDERHLWPVFRELIRERNPPVVFGEQVASSDGRVWLAGVRSDLEAMGYAVGAADLCAAGIGAPHIRQRLYWVARRLEHMPSEQEGVPGQPREQRDATLRLADMQQQRLEGQSRDGDNRSQPGRLDPLEIGSVAESRRPSPWDRYDLVPCADGKARRIESGTFPLANGISKRMDKLRGYGNAIVPQVAAEFIKAAMDVLGIH